MIEPSNELVESTKCPVCNGKGYVQDAVVKYDCPYCEGKGTVNVVSIKKEEIHEIKRDIILDDPVKEEIKSENHNINTKDGEVKKVMEDFNKILEERKIDKKSKEYRDSKK